MGLGFEAAAFRNSSADRAIAGTIAVRGIYDRFDRLPEIRAALAAWANYVEALVSGEEHRGEVVAFEAVGAHRSRSVPSPPSGINEANDDDKSDVHGDEGAGCVGADRRPRRPLAGGRIV